MSVSALICARGGSKGLPGKNLRLLGGRSLIARAVDCALKVKRVERVIISTDDPEIAREGRDAGAEVPFMRPAELARDDSPEWKVWRHALEKMKEEKGSYPDALLVLPPTAPLRAPEDVERCLDEFEKGGVDVVMTITDSHRSPYFNMVTVSENGTAGLVIPPQGKVFRRQDAPVVYDMTTVAYVARPEFVMSSNGMFEGRVRAVRVPVERAIDIDTALDFRVAECLLAGERSK